jgi:hypothetical protein
VPVLYPKSVKKVILRKIFKKRIKRNHTHSSSISFVFGKAIEVEHFITFLQKGIEHTE